MNRLIPVGLALVMVPGPLLAQRLAYEGALGGATGSYFFSERTSSYVLGTGLRFRTGRLTVRASVPVWLQNTTLLTSSGAGPLPTGGPSGQGVVGDSGQARQERQQGGGRQGGQQQGGGQQGQGFTLLASVDPAIPVPTESVTGYQVSIGDPVLGANMQVFRGTRVGLQLGGTVKAPLARTGDVGTGAWDVGGSVSMSVLAGRRMTFGVDVAYWHLGDLDSLALNDPVLASVSIGRLLGNQWGVMVALAGSTTMVDGYDPPATISVAATRFGAVGSWGMSVGTGLSESSPDLVVGLTWTVPWIR